MKTKTLRNKCMTAAVTLTALAIVGAAARLVGPASAQTINDSLTTKRFAFGPLTVRNNPNQNLTQTLRITFNNAFAKSARAVSIQFRDARDGTVLKGDRANLEPGKSLVSTWGGVIDEFPVYGVLAIRAVSPPEVVDAREAAAASMELISNSGTILLADPRPTP